MLTLYVVVCRHLLQWTTLEGNRVHADIRHLTVASVSLERTPAPFGATSLRSRRVKDLPLVGTPDAAAARLLMESNKSAVGVAMQYLVFMDKVHDMRQRHIVSEADHEFLSTWALEQAKSCCMAPVSQRT